VLAVNDSIDPLLWDDYISNSENGTCFHLSGWRNALESVLGYQCHYLAAVKEEKVVGVLPIAIVKSKIFGHSAVSLPFCAYGGAVADNSDIELLLENHANTIAQTNGVDYLEFRKLGKNDPTQTEQHLYYTFQKQIQDKVADLKFLPSKRRNMVRKAQNAGLTAKVLPDLDTFFELYAENARAHGTPALPKEFFRQLFSGLGKQVDILFVFNKDGKAISCIMSFYCNNTIHAGFAGELPEARLNAANDFKYWSLYEHAIARQCTVFDLGRSKLGTGSFQFKKLWGLTERPIVHDLHLIRAQRKPENNPTNPKFKLAMQVWSHLPRPIVDRLGPLVIHGLG
jgi:FemAB-related protein (PEP-CTERM system-associated)